VIYNYNAIILSVTMTFFTKGGKKVVKFIWEHKRPQIAKAILNKNSNAVSITISAFKLYSTEIVPENRDTHTKSDM
jgi:hypothetical protein